MKIDCAHSPTYNLQTGGSKCRKCGILLNDFNQEYSEVKKELQLLGGESNLNGTQPLNTAQSPTSDYEPEYVFRMRSNEKQHLSRFNELINDKKMIPEGTDNHIADTKADLENELLISVLQTQLQQGIEREKELEEKIKKLKGLIKDAHTAGWIDSSFEVEPMPTIEESWQQFKTENNF